jgi:hypothetical protein
MNVMARGCVLYEIDLKCAYMTITKRRIMSSTSAHILFMPYKVGNTFVRDTINMFGMFNIFRTSALFSLLCTYLFYIYIIN